MMMNTVLTSVLLILLATESREIPRVDLKDKEILEELDAYILWLRNQRQDQPFRQQVLLKVEESSGGKVIYLGSGTLVSLFVHDVPDAYAIYGDRFVFLYTNQRDEVIRSSFASFHDQFASVLECDVNRLGEPNESFSYARIFDREVWRVTKEGGKASRMIVPVFPGYAFHERFNYSDQGYLTYLDGVFHESVFKDHLWEPEGFNLRSYLVAVWGLRREFLENNDITASMVIDEKGKVVEAEIEGISDEEIRLRLINALKTMPAWHPGMIQGKPAKTRLKYKL